MSAEVVELKPVSAAEKAVWRVLEQVSDPELPFLSIVDLGIVRSVDLEAEPPEVVITPTYSGCPATETIAFDVDAALRRGGFEHVRLRSVLSPPWSTDWISADGRRKLREHGIAPPVGSASDKRALFAEAPPVACPRCGSEKTELVSAFGSTACKAHYRCTACAEPFDYFKCI